MEKIEITLIENGEHSLKKGIESFNKFKSPDSDNAQNKMLLKEALMFIHHGVELLLKEILVRKSEFLIFSDLKIATQKQLQADRENKGIFYLSKPPHTVTYSDAIDRVCAFVEILDSDFQKSLNELNNFRNQIEHYQIDVTADEIEKIIEDILPSLETLLEDKLQIKLSPDLEKEIKVIQDLSVKRREMNSKAEEEFAEIIPSLSGRKIKKETLQSDEDVIIPVFSKVIREAREYSKNNNLRYIPDFLLEAEDKNWIIEIKGNHFADHTFYNLMDALDKNQDNPQVWLITIGEIESDSLRSKLKEKGIYLTNLRELIKEVKTD